MEGSGWIGYFKSHGDFILSEFTCDKDLYIIAGDVWCDDTHVTVSDVVDLCAQHGWNEMIYEAWLWETGNQVNQLMHKYTGTILKAILVYANYHDYLSGTRSAAYYAISEARIELED